MAAGLYIHIPFCRSKCPYCDFYSISYQSSLAKDYVNILSKVVKKINTKIDTVYIGGGTPSVLPVGFLKRLLKSIKNILESSTENTIEVNPESISKDKLILLRGYNINRISIGMQSLYDSKLKFLGRIHSVKEAKTAVFNAKKCGFSNISIDLIYGIPDEKLSDWKEELKQAAALPVQHISCYSLILEPHTRFYSLRSAIDDEAVARMYLFNMWFLPRAGFSQYEVSNFSLTGFGCKHNIKYWQNLEYIGIGPSAVSFINRKRVKNVSDIKKYVNRYYAGKDQAMYTEQLSQLKYAKELAALKIRTKEGIDFGWFKTKTGFDFFDIEDRKDVYKLKKRGLLVIHKKGGADAGIHLSRKGFLFCDEVSSCFV